MKVRMYPHLRELDGFSSGIAQVIKHYFEYLPEFDVELVGLHATSYDLDAAHAAAHPGAMVNHSHGLLWTDNYTLSGASWRVNANLAEAARQARLITTPSHWVAETFMRDMRINPYVVPHGVDWEAWQHERENAGYVLWAKNRTSDGLNPDAINSLAAAFPNVEFVTTFASGRRPTNVKVLGGAIPHEQMKVVIQQAAVVLATDKETWGILPAEAMAAGVPVLSVDTGAVPEFMRHGQAGYCFRPGNLDDAIQGLDYCLRYRDRLGGNGREMIRPYTWQRAAERIAGAYHLALAEEEATVDIVIPCHNYGEALDGAIRSALEQTYHINRIFVVDDASTDSTAEVVRRWLAQTGESGPLEYIRCDVRNVAEARNIGITRSDAKYVVPLDADDRIERGFVAHLVQSLEQDPALGIAYTGVRVVLQDGTHILPRDWTGPVGEGETTRGRPWPQEFDYDKQLAGTNQIPTCCLIRREALRRVGGYRARYAPEGAGSEDAELFTRIGSIGYKAAYVPGQGDTLFVHTHGEGNVSGNDNYQEPNWLDWHPWVEDGRHPFASIATPRGGRASHPVRFYDQPAVSVIIPVGPGHEDVLVNALDSLEAQTFRNWEVIVVWDNRGRDFRLQEAYPYVMFASTGGGRGAGSARNYGVALSRAPLVAFLDADDYYHPDFLQKVLERFWNTQQVVYTDFVSRMTVDQHKIYGGKVIRTNKNRKEVLVFDRFDDYDCHRARQRPEGSRPYVWSGVTVLLPKLWHQQIGGFDEEMDTWEDCDYLLRLAWRGRCFTRIDEPLWVYDFTSGMRRQRFDGNEEELVAYLQRKYDETGVEKMGCNCGGKIKEEQEEMTSEDTLTVLYAHPNRGRHMVHGAATKKRYGNFGGGVIIPDMAKADIRARPQHFLCPNCQEPFVVNEQDVFCANCSSIARTIERGRPENEAEPIVENPAPPPPPQKIEASPPDTLDVSGDDLLAGVKIDDLDLGRKVNSHHKKLLAEAGVETLADVDGTSDEELLSISNIGETVVETLREQVSRHLES